MEGNATCVCICFMRFQTRYDNCKNLPVFGGLCNILNSPIQAKEAAWIQSVVEQQAAAGSSRQVEDAPQQVVDKKRDQCQATFDQIKKLRDHFKEAHNGQKPLGSTWRCGLRLTEATIRRNHVETQCVRSPAVQAREAAKAVADEVEKYDYCQLCNWYVKKSIRDNGPWDRHSNTEVHTANVAASASAGQYSTRYGARLM